MPTYRFNYDETHSDFEDIEAEDEDAAEEKFWLKHFTDSCEVYEVEEV